MILQSQRHFFEEKRVTLGLADDLIAQRRRQIARADDTLDQRVALLARQRVQHELAVAMAVICLRDLLQTPDRGLAFWPEGAHNQQRPFVGQAEHMRDELHRRGIDPMHIVKDKHRCSISQQCAQHLQIDFNELTLEGLTRERRLTLPRSIFQAQQRRVHFQGARLQIGRRFALKHPR